MGMFWRNDAQGVFSHAFEPFGVNSYAIVGPGGVVVVDSGNNAAQGKLLYDEAVALAHALTSGGVLALVNTHAHFDHCFGNSVFVDAGVPVLGHAMFGDHLMSHAVKELEFFRSGFPPAGVTDGLWDDVVPTVGDFVVTGELRSSEFAWLNDFGRDLVFHALDPAHTTADLLIHIEDVDVWITGDIVEQSGPPSIESDSNVNEWVITLDDLVTRTQPSTRFLPGHGTPVHADFITQLSAQLRSS